ncbi:MAG: glycosyltransferase [Spirochaetes bacterium]|nr:glycosyltransferase [Spirochaetota bacterium]
MSNKIKILYLHTCPTIGGSSRSLVLLYKELIKYNVEGIVLTSKGEVINYYKNNGFKVYIIKWLSQFDNTEYSYYKGIRWLVFIRELFYFIPSLIKVIKIIKKENVKIIHLNEGNLFIYCFFLKKLFKKIKILIHIRAIQSNKKGIRRKVFTNILKNYVDQIICIDERVKNSLNASLFYKTLVVHNGIEFNDNNNYYFNKLKNVNLLSDCFNLGFIGVLYKAKGIDTILKAIDILINEKKLNKIKLYIAGKNSRIFKNKFFKKIVEILGLFFDMEKYIFEFIEKKNLTNYVKYLGFIKNNDDFYKKIDLLLFTTNLFAIGRPVFEAAKYGIPSIVTLKEPIFDDEIFDNYNGFTVNELNEEELANKIEYIYNNIFNNKNKLLEISDNVLNYFKRYFILENNANIIYNIYKNYI